MDALNALLVLDEQGRTWVDLGLLAEQSGVHLSRLKRSAWRAANLNLAQVTTRTNRTLVLRQDCYHACRKFRTGKDIGRPTISLQKREAVLEGLRNGKTPYKIAKELNLSQVTVGSIKKASQAA